MSNQEDNIIFNRKSLQANRTRAARKKEDVTFLLNEVSDELAFRLSAITRSFETSICLGTHLGVGSDELSSSGNISNLIHLDPCPAMMKNISGPKIIADEECLPLKDGSTDLVISPLSLQWVNDLPGCLIQIRRALKPDGLFMAALIGGESLHELRTCFMTAESSLTDGAYPRVSPFVDVKAFGGLLQRAGFALPVIDREIRTVRYDTPLGLMHDLRHMGASNSLNDRARTFLRRDVLAKMMEYYADHYADPDGRIRASFEIVYVSAWAPDESQPKPLKPGSATHSLAEALKKSEKL